ncbi:MAG: mechanosensitive ion channel family protein, partial [Parvibaculaceae bacterium]
STYVGMILVAALALSSAGLDFSNLAIIAGALGVGIGFGLQSIVNNFVSGLILLAERPIKVGDWIKVTSGEGIVKRINVRSTEIETFDKCAIIVPNSSLISDSVSNWTHGDIMGRVRIPIGVSHDSDPRQVEKILLECGKKHERILAFPQPFVRFQGVSANSLDFDFFGYVSDVNTVSETASDLRYDIMRRFKETGIEIPHAKSEVRIKELEDLIEVLRGEEKPARKAPAKKDAT